MACSSMCWRAARESTHVTFSPDGQRIVSATDGGEVSSFSVQTGELLSTRTGAPGVERLAFSADGAILVSQGCTILWPGAKRGRAAELVSRQAELQR